jgi:hypothetical protein
VVLGVLVLAGLLAPGACAQREPGSWTVGPQVGRPGGLTAKLYRTAPTAYDGVATVDGDDFARLSLHRLRERPLPDSLVHVYYGPGVLVEARRLDASPDVDVGVGGKVGLNFYAERFEVFLHVTPTLRLRPAPVPGLGGSVGLRYDLRQP